MTITSGSSVQSVSPDANFARYDAMSPNVCQQQNKINFTGRAHL
ncbi:hypothetical protein N9V74_05195 [Alteromonas sp.]|nr:hypothetical protein [Alteromonas sp.]